MTRPGFEGGEADIPGSRNPATRWPGSRRGRPCRPFTLLDAAILVGVVAVALCGAVDHFRFVIGGMNWSYILHDMASYSLTLAATFLLIVRLRRPRPPIRRVARQPGTAACFAMTASVLAYNVGHQMKEAVDGLWSFDRSASLWIWTVFNPPFYTAACDVPIVWSILALSRARRPEPGWIDRSGRAVGWSWIAWGLSGPFLRLF